MASETWHPDRHYSKYGHSSTVHGQAKKKGAGGHYTWVTPLDVIDFQSHDTPTPKVVLPRHTQQQQDPLQGSGSSPPPDGTAATAMQLVRPAAATLAATLQFPVDRQPVHTPVPLRSLRAVNRHENHCVVQQTPQRYQQGYPNKPAFLQPHVTMSGRGR
eukprot:TRINITY_DN15654_c0_g1_i2.p1 TRINITY_DN15654_c0_g1~~TRINITY_DN15654_c0_g1_i2.p1  ORF type:complete len:187 (-),score=23.03 TRINITY_DN15654_c0_g1_i2:360-836(-)